MIIAKLGLTIWLFGLTINSFRYYVKSEYEDRGMLLCFMTYLFFSLCSYSALYFSLTN